MSSTSPSRPILPSHAAFTPGNPAPRAAAVDTLSLDQVAPAPRANPAPAALQRPAPDAPSQSSHGWRILGFGKHAEVAAGVQASLRAAGFQAKAFALENTEAGDERLLS